MLPFLPWHFFRKCLKEGYHVWRRYHSPGLSKCSILASSLIDCKVDQKWILLNIIKKHHIKTALYLVVWLFSYFNLCPFTTQHSHVKLDEYFCTVCKKFKSCDSLLAKGQSPVKMLLCGMARCVISGFRYL